MATTIHQPPAGSNHVSERDRSGGGWKNLVPAGGDVHLAQGYAPPPASTGIWVVLFSITMTFLALTSALIVRKGSAPDWQHFSLPSILYLNTLFLIASSFTLEVARRRVAAFMGGFKSKTETPERWLYITLCLGLLFVVGQYFAWQQLRAEGLFLATNPSSSFFYLLTAAHALHVLGGLSGLTYVTRRLSQRRLRRSALNAASHYWHFMGGLWVYLLVLLWVKL